MADEDFEAALTQLVGEEMEPLVGMGGSHQDAQAFTVCDPLADRIGPAYVIPLRRSLILREVLIRRGDDIEGVPDIALSCNGFDVDGLRASFGLSLTFHQVWHLSETAISDLASSISLAPAESLTLEFQASQRKVLEQSTVQSTEELLSHEATIADKEVINVTRSSSRTSNWNVEANGQYGIGKSFVSASASASESLVESAQGSLEQITESTNKSSRALKTLHKIEVRGTTETFVQNRMARLIKNPYRDRTLSLNIFELVKRFSVATTLDEVGPTLVVELSGLRFDASFIGANVDFLANNLVDETLLEYLPLAVTATEPRKSAGLQERAAKEARRALRLLFAEPNIFNIHPLPMPNGTSVDPNLPDSSFDATIFFLDRTGFADALQNNLGPTFTLLNLFFKLYQDLSDVEKEELGVTLCMAIADDVSPLWTTLGVENPEALRNVLDPNDLTEVFRRLSGFLALANRVVRPLADAASAAQNEEKSTEDARRVLDQLIRHLRCNRSFYTAKLLDHLSRRTGGRAIIDFVSELLNRTTYGSAMRGVIDVDRSFISGPDVIVPASRRFSREAIVRFLSMLKSHEREPAEIPWEYLSAVTTVEVPADGIHLEAVAGECKLDDLPDSTGSGSVLVDNLKLEWGG